MGAEFLFGNIACTLNLEFTSEKIVYIYFRKYLQVKGFQGYLTLQTSHRNRLLQAQNVSLEKSSKFHESDDVAVMF